MPQKLVVFSHLRWDFVYQRPQHLLSRLAKHHPVYFFEEPIRGTGPSTLELTTPAPNVTVCRPYTANPAVGFHDDQLPELKLLLDELVQEHVLSGAIAWFYSPMALPLAQQLQPTVVVYDCMDELSAFLNAPKQLQQRENALLKVADLVFTGGRSLFRAKRERHPDVHCFPSSVDRAHFAQALRSDIDHADQQELPRPRLGYFGVLDERIDVELLAELADAHPEWQLPVVGPIVKIPVASLPVRPNIHYLGQRPYDELPKFVAGWDVCLLPFALNQATRYISPTKTLEYMAAEKRIVSTPIADVVEPYGDIVLTANRSTFRAACERALEMHEAEWQQRRDAMRATVARTSWDSTANQMLALLHEAAARQRATGPGAESPLAITRRERKAPAKAGKRIAYRTVIIGAGAAGLSAAYHLGKDSLLVERNSTVGGWCRSVEDKGYTFDYAGHVMCSNDPSVHTLYAKLLGDNVRWQDREAWIYSKGVHTRYPFQGSLYGLPPEVLKECVVGAIEARFGKLRGESSSAPTKTLIDAAADGADVACITGVTQRPSLGERQAPPNFEDYIYDVWGEGIAQHFAIPYNRKLWTVPLSELDTSWLGDRVPAPQLDQIIDGAFRPARQSAGRNARFGYPRRGGFQALMNGFLPLLQGDLELGVELVSVDLARHEAVLDDGTVCKFGKLLSTMQLPALVAMLGDDVPDYVRRAAAKLRHVSIRRVNLGIARQPLTDKHWVYYPEDTVFHRVFLQGNLSPYCNPPGGFGVACEIAYSPSKPLPCQGEDLIDRCIGDCLRVGLFTPADTVEVAHQLDLPYAYVIHDHARRESVETIKRWLAAHDVLVAGRFGEWEYYDSDHAFIAGRKAAEAALSSATASAMFDAG